jgi:hypothetical protein
VLRRPLETKNRGPYWKPGLLAASVALLYFGRGRDGGSLRSKFQHNSQSVDPSFQTDITRRFEKDAMISAVRPSLGLQQRASLNQCQHEGLVIDRARSKGLGPPRLVAGIETARGCFCVR